MKNIKKPLFILYVVFAYFWSCRLLISVIPVILILLDFDLKHKIFQSMFLLNYGNFKISVVLSGIGLLLNIYYLFSSECKLKFTLMFAIPVIISDLYLLSYLHIAAMS